MFDVLASDFVSDALYHSEKRRSEHAVICQPETQTNVLSAIRAWANSTADTSCVCWLSGPAGTGKSTVAHTIAAEYDKNGRLAASFFFWRKTGDRDDLNKLIATLAYQIAEKIPLAKEGMEENLRLKNDQEPLTVLSDRFSKSSLEDRLSKLLINRSILDADPAAPDILVIDGLDECSSREGICRLVEWIRKNELPFRLLLTSRPEPEFESLFISGPQLDVRALCLTESQSDIRKYFVEELEKVWPTQRRIKKCGPSQWPSQSDLEKLVEKSEGLFVYAATAVRYIGDSEGNPSKRLEEVLELHKGLDSLYVQVIDEARKQDCFDIVMGSIMYLKYPLSVADLSIILFTLNKHLTPSGILSALRRCHSILSIPERSTINPYHASLRDFLTDHSRATTLFLAPAMCHGRLMLACLSAITNAFREGSTGPRYALVSWYYHAYSVLTTSSGDSETLGEMKGEIQELVKKIDLDWVKSWLIESVHWERVMHLSVELPSTKVQSWNLTRSSIIDRTDARNSRTHPGRDSWSRSWEVSVKFWRWLLWFTSKMTA